MHIMNVLKERMAKDYTKAYIEVTEEFRKSNASKQSVEKLYDLLYALEGITRTKHQDLTLSNVFSLLGYHQSAYELFKSTADLNDRKTTSKLYMLREKAQSHKNQFVIKDVRKLRQKNLGTRLVKSDFIFSEKDDTGLVVEKTIVIFNKSVKPDKVKISIYGHLQLSVRERLIAIAV